MQAIVGFLGMLRKTLSAVDIQCKVLPIIHLYMKHPVIQLDKQVRKSKNFVILIWNCLLVHVGLICSILSGYCVKCITSSNTEDNL